MMTPSRTISIGERQVGLEHPPLVVAEMSGNHNQSLERALAIVDAAAAAGAHALKIQTYTPDTMTLELDEGEFHISDPNSLWKGTSLYQLYGEAQTPWEWHAPIYERARGQGMLVFSTPFDESAVEFLETLDTPCYKIASFENTDLPLIRRVAATGRPMIISTGMASVGELDETVAAARSAGCNDLILLKCTSAYPASPESCNIVTIPHLRDLFRCEVGLSDHTMGTGIAVASVALGATVIEKHFTLRRTDGGVDSSFSLEPDELARLVEETDRAWRALGTVKYGTTEAERASIVFRRSLYIVKDLNAGDVLTRDCIRAIRPGLGLPPKYLDQLVGRTVRQDVRRGTAADWSLLA
jgi:pseudaminic acid synthase